MADDRDILGKADALLRRHAPARPGSGDGSDVPVLTELITPGASQAAPAQPAGAPAAPLRDDAFTRELVAEVVNIVHSRLAQDLERQLAQHVTAEVRAAVADTLGDLRQEIANAATDAVAQALARRAPR
jgi:hypothetical protein